VALAWVEATLSWLMASGLLTIEEFKIGWMPSASLRSNLRLLVVKEVGSSACEIYSRELKYQILSVERFCG